MGPTWQCGSEASDVTDHVMGGGGFWVQHSGQHGAQNGGHGTSDVMDQVTGQGFQIEGCKPSPKRSTFCGKGQDFQWQKPGGRNRTSRPKMVAKVVARRWDICQGINSLTRGLALYYFYVYSSKKYLGRTQSGMPR